MSDQNNDRAVEFLEQLVEQADEDGFERVIAEARAWLQQVKGSHPPPPPEVRVPMPTLRKNRYNFYCVPVPTPNGRCKLVSTGETNLVLAKRMVQETGVDRLVLLARSGAITADAVVLATTGRRLVGEELHKIWKAELSIDAAASTASTYSDYIALFFERIGAWTRPLVWITRKQLSDFVNEPGAKLGTRSLRKAALSSLYKFAQARGMVLGNLAATISIRHQEMTWEEKEPRVVLPITPDEYKKIMASKLSFFHRCATIICYWSALRFVDICKLQPASIQEDSLIAWTIKRKHRLVLPFSNPLIGTEELVACLRYLKANPFTEQWCFPEALEYDENESAMAKTYIYMLRRVGIQGKSFNSLRHSAMSRFYAAGTSIEEIGGLVGHRSPKTTMGYIHPAPVVVVAPAPESEVTA